MSKINDCTECAGEGEVMLGESFAECPFCKGIPKENKSNKPVLKIIGTNGNAFALLARAQSVAKKAGMTNDQIREIIDEAMDGEYNHLLQVLMKYFEVE